MHSIQQCLKELRIDFAYTQRKFKLEAVVYTFGVQTDVTIRAYNNLPQGETIVEFRKMDGCAEGRANMFRDVVATLHSRVTPICPGLATPTQIFELPALPADLSPLPAESYRELVSGLICFSQNEYLDQQQQAAEELCSVSYSHPDWLADSLPEILSVVVRFLSSGNETLVRCGALILANTCECPAVHKMEPQHMEHVLTPLFHTLDAVGGSFAVLESKRQIARALSALANTQREAISRCISTSHLSVLSRYESSFDDTLRAEARKATNCLLPLMAC